MKIDREEIRHLTNEEDLIGIIVGSDCDDWYELFCYVDTVINEQDITYYSKAMEYLSENDDSLRTSLELAHDMGYEARDLNSELLATILLQDTLSSEWSNIQNDVEEIFNKKLEEEKEDEDES